MLYDEHDRMLLARPAIDVTLISSLNASNSDALVRACVVERDRIGLELVHASEDGLPYIMAVHTLQTLSGDPKKLKRVGKCKLHVTAILCHGL